MAKKHLTRHDLRNQLIRYKGQSIKATAWLEQLAKDLPEMRFKDGRKVDHHEELKKFYYEHRGIEGAKKYVRHIQRVCNNDLKKYQAAKFWDKVKTWLGFKKQENGN